MRRGLIFSLVGIVGLVALAFSGLASASVNYCQGDYVVPGGVSGAAAVNSAYTHPRVAHVYNYFGITKQDINDLSAQSVTGTVTKSGKVIVGGKVVATQATSAGCGFISGSTKVNDGYMTFYTRPTSVSFAKSSLPAMVVMKNNHFAFAILKSCGNPVMATPVKHKKTTTVSKTVITNQTQTVVVNAAPPQVKAAQTTLPNTGPGNILGVSGLAAGLGSAGHYLYRRRRY